jgi:hypothetical protein
LKASINLNASQYRLQARSNQSAMMASPVRGVVFLLESAEPRIHVGLDFLLGVAIPLLQHALKLRPATLDDVKITIGQLTPLGLRSALKFFPFSFDLIPIHDDPPSA